MICALRRTDFSHRTTALSGLSVKHTNKIYFFLLLLRWLQVIGGVYSNPLNIHAFSLFLKSFYVVVFYLLIVSLIPLIIPPLFSFSPVFLRNCNGFCPYMQPQNGYITPLKQLFLYSLCQLLCSSFITKSQFLTFHNQLIVSMLRLFYINLFRSFYSRKTCSTPWWRVISFLISPLAILIQSFAR